jgi:hypothetical protein
VTSRHYPLALQRGGVRRVEEFPGLVVAALRRLANHSSSGGTSVRPWKAAAVRRPAVWGGRYG